MPEKFTFPFFYSPHPLAKIAAEELQNHLLTQQEWLHDFGLENPLSSKAIGKMFGVLVVRNKRGKLGYLAAFSGKLAESNHWQKFVPPVFDILQSDGFYKTEGREVDTLNDLVEKAKNNPLLEESKNKWLQAIQKQKIEIENFQAQVRANRQDRKAKRKEAEENLSNESLQNFLKQLSQDSIKEQYFLKDTVRAWKEKTSQLESMYLGYFENYQQLKKQRAKRSFDLQKKIFDHYLFSNANGEQKSLMDIFSFLNGGFPPSGSGECAAPKLLHYAFENELKPICMAEFWWGKESHMEIRKHKHFYPACRSKCEPILGHMLVGLEIDENPILQRHFAKKEVTIVYEDEALMVVHKPHDFLSVKGKISTDSVQERMEKRIENSERPILVHRLDMATSGLLLVAKNLEVHKMLQSLFIKRTIKKRYVALLEGILEPEKGVIDLPLRLDLDNRPHQLVCEEFGKKSRTEFEVISRQNNQTRIHFYPITGRSHQLRVHASHPLGLNLPIVGDDLYGNKAERLYLHAEWLKFTHPITKQEIEFEVKAPF